MNDPFDLDRFVTAQQGVYDAVVGELRDGRKRSHWMWFIFPQLSGLGRSSTARLYAISSQEEAQAFSNHTILGPRLRECTQLVLNVRDRTAEQIFGSIDTLKFRSCMTLFDRATAEDTLYRQALEKYFQGAADQQTLNSLA